LERVAIRVKPGGGGHGAARRRAGDGGRAHALAAALGVRRSAVTLVSGPAARDKVVAVDPAPAGLAARVATLRDGTGA
jgi:hypothetical protein